MEIKGQQFKQWRTSTKTICIYLPKGAKRLSPFISFIYKKLYLRKFNNKEGINVFVDTLVISSRAKRRISGTSSVCYRDFSSLRSSTSEAMLHQECPASLFEREAEVLFGALKTKSCLSGASSFSLGKKRKFQLRNGSRRIFFLFRFSFVRAKEK